MTRLDGLLRRTRSGAGPSPASQELRRVLVGADPAAGTIDVAYEACEQPTDPTGYVQADLLAAMLKDTLEDLVTPLQADQQATALDLQVHFLVPVRPGVLYGRGWLVERSPGLVHLAGELVNPFGEPVAQATATAVIPGNLTSSAHDQPAAYGRLRLQRLRRRRRRRSDRAPRTGAGEHGPPARDPLAPRRLALALLMPVRTRRGSRPDRA